MALAIVNPQPAHVRRVDAAVGAVIECLDEAVKSMDAQDRFHAMLRIHGHITERMHSMKISGLVPDGKPA